MTGSSITFTLLLKVIPVLWKQTGIRVVELGRVPLILTPSECKIWVGYPGGNMEEVFTSCQPGLLQLRWCHVLFLKKSFRFYVTPVPRQKPISSLWELLVFSLGKKLQSDHRTSFRWESLTVWCHCHLLESRRFWLLMYFHQHSIVHWIFFLPNEKLPKTFVQLYSTNLIA